MVCDGPEPPELNHNELDLPPSHDLFMNGQDSEDENDHFGYEPLPLGPNPVIHSDHESEDETENASPPSNIPPIEPVDHVLTRDLWNSARILDPIIMDTERVRAILTAMQNIFVPEHAFPPWARAISDEQWRESLRITIEKLRSGM